MSKWRSVPIQNTDGSIADSGDIDTSGKFRQALKSMQEEAVSYCSINQIQTSGPGETSVEYETVAGGNTVAKVQHQHQGVTSIVKIQNRGTTSIIQSQNRGSTSTVQIQNQGNSSIVQSVNGGTYIVQGIQGNSCIVQGSQGTSCIVQGNVGDLSVVQSGHRGTTSSVQHVSQGPISLEQNMDQRNGLEAIPYSDPPIIKDSEHCKKLILKFDVSKFPPESVAVSINGKKIQVQARSESKSETNKGQNTEIRIEMRAIIFDLIEGADPETVQADLSKDGVLKVQANISGEK